MSPILLLKILSIFPRFPLVSLLLSNTCLFVCLFFQLSIIEPIKRDVIEARNAMNMGDYPSAIEFLGKAIEVFNSQE